MIDFSKAVDQVVLMSKLVQLELPSFVINWICSFLTGRGQQCKVNDTVSSLADIGLSIVQGSGIGPTLYIIMKSDLSTLSALNDIFKYADDTTLLVPQHTDTELQQKFNHVRSWAANNRLILNLSKTKEMVFKQSRVWCFHMPAALDDVEQIDCCKLLGVMFQSNFKMDSRVNYLLSQCAQRMYILKHLRHQGMSSDQIITVAYALILSRIMYALPAWGGFLSAALIDKINAFLSV